MKNKQTGNEYNSFAEWRAKLFSRLERETELNELKKDSGKLGTKLANESIDKVLQGNKTY